MNANSRDNNFQTRAFCCCYCCCCCFCVALCCRALRRMLLHRCCSCCGVLLEAAVNWLFAHGGAGGLAAAPGRGDRPARPRPQATPRNWRPIPSLQPPLSQAQPQSQPRTAWPARPLPHRLSRRLYRRASCLPAPAADGGWPARFTLSSPRPRRSRLATGGGSHLCTTLSIFEVILHRKGAGARENDCTAGGDRLWTHACSRGWPRRRPRPPARCTPRPGHAPATNPSGVLHRAFSPPSCPRP